MKCLVPLMTKSPPRCTALVCIPRRSEPACGSLMARHSTRSPRTLKPLRCTAGKRIASLAIAALPATRIGVDLLERFHQSLRGFSRAVAVSVHAVDGDQPGRLLHRPQGTLFDPRDIQPQRHVWTLELARADRRHGARPVRTRPLRYYSINAHSAAWRQLSFARHIRVHASPGTSPGTSPGRQPHFPCADASVQHTRSEE